MTDWNSLLSEYRRTGAAEFGALVRSCIKRERDGVSPDLILAQLADAAPQVVRLQEQPVPYPVWLAQGDRIESAAFDQMNTIARLPVFLAGALMPDAHPGYGAPIGAVCALHQSVAPYLVGVDIGCRVSALLFQINKSFENGRPDMEGAVKEVARFGMQTLKEWHPVMNHPLWKTIPVLSKNFDRAVSQLGTSGGGNHFIDLLHFGYCTPGRYVIMCHSGSRGIGAIVARHYSELAAEECEKKRINVPRNYEYLHIGGSIGAEYYEVMNLMVRYSLACHELILARFCRAAEGLISQIDIADKNASVDLSGRSGRSRRAINYWSNPHNFASLDGPASLGAGAVIHRKGATPAAHGQPGLIPGSSGSNSYLVSGLGNERSLYSASHGAGRPRSRTESKKIHDESAFTQTMAEKDIHFVGVDPDETVYAYKDIDKVIAAQSELVTPIALLRPFFAMMAGRANHDDGD